jgi:hypothetical protein
MEVVMRQFVLGSAILGLLLTAGVALAGESECTATITGTLMRKEGSETGTAYTAKVDVSVPATCAVVRFDLIVVEEEPGGKQTEVRVPKEVKIRDSVPTSLKLNYKLKKGRTVVSHRFQQTSCELCE